MVQDHVCLQGIFPGRKKGPVKHGIGLQSHSTQPFYPWLSEVFNSAHDISELITCGLQNGYKMT